MYFYQERVYCTKNDFKNEQGIIMLVEGFKQNFIIGLFYFSPCLNDDYCFGILALALEQVEALNFNCPIIVGGDFNGRVGDLNQVDETVLSGLKVNLTGVRKTMDGKINARGRSLVEFFEERSFLLLNGISIDDNPARFTYCGQQGNSTVDLVFCNFAYLYSVLNFCVSPLVTQSDHLPVALSLESMSDMSSRRGKYLGGESCVWGLKWKGHLYEEFAEKMSWHPNVQWKGGSHEVASDTLVSAVTQVAESLGMRKGTGRFRHNKPWFNAACYTQKKKVKQTLKKCFESNFVLEDNEAYKKEKKVFKNLVEKNKKLFED